tara:strand:- start:411 stop:569 length:159 start_codon:yes stop_codon:yes gene_type:complete
MASNKNLKVVEPCAVGSWKLEMEQKINGRTESIATLTDELRGSIPLQATKIK